MSNIVPEKALNFNVYADGGILLGVAEGQFPNGEFMTSEVKGAGIAGVVDSPGFGQLGSMTLELTWRTTSKDWGRLLHPNAHILDMYAAHLSFDAGLGIYKTSEVHAYVKAVTKTFDAGKLAVSESSDSKTVHEVYYIKLEIDGEEQLEVDKYNYIYRVQGIDYLQEIRRALGK